MGASRPSKPAVWTPAFGPEQPLGAFAGRAAIWGEADAALAAGPPFDPERTSSAAYWDRDYPSLDYQITARPAGRMQLV